MSADFTVEEIGDAAGLAALAPQWWHLWRRTPTATPFQSPAWLIPWWQHFHPGVLCTIAIRHGSELAALAPFYLENAASGQRMLPIGMSVSDYLDVLIDPACTDRAGRALRDHASQPGRQWSQWDLEELAPDALALCLPAPVDCVEEVRWQSACPVLALPDGARGENEWLPSGMRRHLRLARNRAARRGGITVERGDAESARPILDLLFRLHAARWHDRGEPGVLRSDPVQRFQSAAVPLLIEAGLLRLNLLRIGGEPAAAYYGFMHRDRAYGYLTGLDPAFAFESPGAILIADAIEEARREGAREFHFLRGREAYKYHWGAVDRWNRRRSFRTAHG